MHSHLDTICRQILAVTNIPSKSQKTCSFAAVHGFPSNQKAIFAGNSEAFPCRTQVIRAVVGQNPIARPMKSQRQAQFGPYMPVQGTIAPELRQDVPPNTRVRAHPRSAQAPHTRDLVFTLCPEIRNARGRRMLLGPCAQSGPHHLAPKRAKHAVRVLKYSTECLMRLCHDKEAPRIPLERLLVR